MTCLSHFLDLHLVFQDSLSMYSRLDLFLLFFLMIFYVGLVSIPIFGVHTPRLTIVRNWPREAFCSVSN